MPKAWLTAALIFFAPAGASANQVMEKIEVKTTPEKAWTAIGDFCAIRDWHPSVASCDLNADGKALVRTLTSKDGATSVEQELKRSDAARAYSYRILETKLPVEKYVSTIRVLPMGRGGVSILWVGAFKPVGSAAEAEKAVAAEYLAGLKGLKAKLEAK